LNLLALFAEKGKERKIDTVETTRESPDGQDFPYHFSILSGERRSPPIFVRGGGKGEGGIRFFNMSIRFEEERKGGKGGAKSTEISSSKK